MVAQQGLPTKCPGRSQAALSQTRIMHLSVFMSIVIQNLSYGVFIVDYFSIWELLR
jgi:hypothetical protein